MFSIPAHNAAITQTQFIDHSTLASCSFDRTVKIWSISADWRLVTTLEGHEGKVLAIDHNPDSLASVSTDRTVKLWSP